jgi:DNA-binding transcriptional ArsR family regulator
MKTDKRAQNLDSVFEALAHKHRRAIIEVVASQPVSISRLAKMRRLSLPAIHKHIKVLEKAQLIMRQKTGQTTYLALRRHALFDLQQWLMHYRAYWGTDSESLENYADYLQKNDPPPSTQVRGKKGGEHK